MRDREYKLTKYSATTALHDEFALTPISRTLTPGIAGRTRCKTLRPG